MIIRIIKNILLIFVIIFIKESALYAQNNHAHNSSIEFIENKNQWNKNVLYKADIGAGALFLEKSKFTFVFKDIEAIKELLKFKTNGFDNITLKNTKSPDLNIKYHAYTLNFLNANPDVIVSSYSPTEGYYNYFRGKDKRRWASNVKSYKTISYKNIYNKTDIHVYSDYEQIKYDIIVNPGANPTDIKIQYKGLDSLFLKDGNLRIKTSVNEIIEAKPSVYQMDSDNKIEIPCSYFLKGDILSFVFPRGYDVSKQLIIDPILIFSTYSGSSIDNWGFTATYDSYGNAYSGGIAFGTGYPTTIGAFQFDFAGGEFIKGVFDSLGCDVAIIKYDSSGTKRLWATYLGGARNDIPHSMIVNNKDELVLFGTTGSSNFPVTTGVYDQTFNGGDSIMYDNVITYSRGIDIFVSKLSADGSKLIASTYIGGTKNDGMNYPSILSKNYADGARGEIMIDSQDNIYIASTTNSTDFPVTSGAFQPFAGGGGQDGCIFKFNSSLINLIWSSYIGGSSNDAAYGIAIDKNSNVYITGGTSSENFPVTASSLNKTYLGGYADGFITKISSNGNTILNSTFFGSIAYDQSYLIQLDKQGNVYVYGQTADTLNTLIWNASWYVLKGGQFVSKLNADLSQFIWSTVFGTGKGGPDISPTAFLVDLCNKIYLSGWGGATNGFGGTFGLPITADAFQDTTDNSDYYLMVMSDDASSLEYATFFGSPHAHEHVDGGTSRFDRMGRIYQSVCGGCGGFDDFPTTAGAWSNTNNSQNCNNALFKFDFQMPLVIADFVNPNECSPLEIQFQNLSKVSGTSGVNYFWNFGDGNTSTNINPLHVYTSPGIYNVKLIVSDIGSCNTADTVSKQITVSNISLQAGPDTTICVGDFLLKANTTGNIKSYLWSLSSDLSDTLNYSILYNPVLVHPTDTTTYYIQVTDIYNCSVLDSIKVNVIGLFANISLLIEPSCYDSCNGQASISAWGGLLPYSYLWNNGNTSQTIKNLCAGIYTLTISDAFGCSEKKVFVVNQPNKILLTTNSYNTICQDPCNAAAIASTIGGVPAYSYMWSNMQNTDSISSLCEGWYYVTVTDKNKCIAIDSLFIPDSLANAQYIHTYADKTSIYPSQTTGLHTSVIQGVTYSWTPSATLTNPNAPNTIAAPTETTQYTVIITDMFNCVYVDTITIFIKDVFCNESEVFIPNAFTPNGDFNNDILYVRSNILKNIYFVIYDRWGEKVFETYDMTKGWDGTFRGRKCDPAVYDYYIKADCFNDEELIKKGNITLIR